MIYRLSKAYLGRLESERNSKLFYGYMIATAVCVGSIAQLGLRAAPFGVVAYVAAAAFHWRLNRIHARNLATAQQVEVEVVENRLVYRSAVSEQRLFLDQLQSVEQASKFEPIKLVFTAAPPFMLDGLHDADKLVEELAAYVR